MNFVDFTRILFLWDVFWVDLDYFYHTGQNADLVPATGGHLWY